jgi:DNA modification methylase
VFGGVVLDESSILKSFTGATRNLVIEYFANTPMKLCATATPAPNDFMELGNHSEFLGVLTRTEMLSTFFVHDGGDTSKWRLKGHAEEEYWKWICQWAVMLRQPADLGYENNGFILPPLNYHHHVVKSERNLDGFLFPVEAQTLMERRGARRNSLNERVELCAALVNESTEPWLVWCDLNAEGDALTKLIPDAVQVAGRHKDEDKESRMFGFSEGKHRVLISKPSICGWGMNWHHCSNVAFVGLSDSWEQWYQAIRRCWRFGQTREVNCHVITSEAEGAVVRNIQRKEADAARMAKEMVKHMSVYNTEAVHTGTVRTADVYQTRVECGERWEMRLGDCVELVKNVPDDSVHYSIFSPPFASLYTYSASERDMGNARTHSEFYEHFEFLVAELYRVLMPGRLLSFHCMNLPTSKERDGVIGISDFRGDLIRMFTGAGFIYHSEVVIWKDPVTAMQRTKALGLLHKQLVKDSCMSRQGIPDYLVTMRKPGENPERVAGPLTYYVGDDPAIDSSKWNPELPRPSDEVRSSINIWQRYASPVWDDINPSDTLQRESAREDADERHVCPLQLQVIERGVQLWTNPGDLVYSPFAGIGSEGYRAVQMGRRFLGHELKESYFKQACANLRNAEAAMEQTTLFSGVAG